MLRVRVVGYLSVGGHRRGASPLEDAHERPLGHARQQRLAVHQLGGHAQRVLFKGGSSLGPCLC